MKYVHKYVESPESKVEEYLRDLEDDGWELVSTQMYTKLYERTFVLFFKRPAEMTVVIKGKKK